jgi:hypothetical protein
VSNRSRVAFGVSAEGAFSRATREPVIARMARAHRPDAENAKLYLLAMFSVVASAAIALGMFLR